jgi:hypothetical protein
MQHDFLAKQPFDLGQPAQEDALTFALETQNSTHDALASPPALEGSGPLGAARERLPPSQRFENHALCHGSPDRIDHDGAAGAERLFRPHGRIARGLMLELGIELGADQHHDS